MGHVGVICPNAPGHVNAILALADATRARGHRVTFFLLGEPPTSVTAAGFVTISLGGTAIRYPLATSGHRVGTDSQPDRLDGGW